MPSQQYIQSMAATEEQVAALDGVVAKLGLTRADLAQESAAGCKAGLLLSREEARALGRLAFDLDTSIACLLRGFVRSGMRRLSSS